MTFTAQIPRGGRRGRSWKQTTRSPEETPWRPRHSPSSSARAPCRTSTTTRPRASPSRRSRRKGQGAPRVEDGRGRAGRAQPRPADRLRVRQPAARATRPRSSTARPPPRPRRPRPRPRRRPWPTPRALRSRSTQQVDPTLPAVPAGAVKKFTVDVLQHVTQVDPDLAPTEAWSYAVNGKAYRGTAASPPIVVNQGDKVQITFVNGGSKAMAVNMAALDRLPLRRGRPEQELHRRRARQAADDQLRRRAPGRLHVPLRDAAGPHAHERGHDGHDGRQAAQPAAGRQGAVDDPGGVLPRRPRQAGRHGQDGGRDARRHGLQRLRQPVQGAPDHRPPRREDPHVRPRRRPEQVERLPRHRHGLRHAPSSRASSGTTRRRSRSRPARAAGSSSRSTTRATTRSSPTPSATWSRAPRASCTPPARRRSRPRRRRRRPPPATTWAP